MKNVCFPPKKMMYAPLQENYQKMKFRDIKDDPIFDWLTDEEKAFLKGCRVVFVYKYALEAFRSTLPKEKQGMKDKDIQKKYPYYYKKNIFRFDTTGSLVIGEKDNGYFLINDLLGRSKHVYKTCSICFKTKHTSKFNGGKCLQCKERVNKDKLNIRAFIDKEMATEKQKDIILYGKHVWQTNITEDFADQLAENGLAEWGYKEVYMLMDSVDFEQENINFQEQLLKIKNKQTG